MRYLSTAILCIFLSACTSMSNKAALVKDADERMIYEQNCNFLGLVIGTSGWGNAAVSTGINNAKNEALDKAADLGATHILWTSINSGYTCSVTGKAYDCNKTMRK